MKFQKKLKQRTYAEALADYRAKYGQTSGQKEVVLKQGTSKEEPQPFKQPSEKSKKILPRFTKPTKRKIKIKSPIGYRKQLSTNLQRQFTPQAPRVKKAPSQKQILARKKFILMAQRNRQLQELLRQQQSQSLPQGMARQESSTPPSIQPPQQFRRPQPVGVWRANPNNGMGSKVPAHIPRYGRRTFFIEADILGNPQIKIAGGAESFFN